MITEASETGDKARVFDHVRILVAEDDEVNRLLLNLLLQKWGCDTEVVNNGNEVVEHAEKGKYDAIIMDLEMPGMSGIEATRKLRTAGVTVPIIGITHIDYRGRALGEGMSGLVKKPVEPEKLQYTLAKLLEIKI